MKLYIKYTDTLGSVFLAGNNGEDFFNKEREPLKNQKRKISSFVSPDKNTAKGIIYRLVGDQRRLWDILQNNNYLNLQDETIHITNEKSKFIHNKETISLRYPHGLVTKGRLMRAARNPNGFRGPFKGPDQHFFFTDPKIYQQFLAPFTCDMCVLYDFIINGVPINPDTAISIQSRVDILNFKDNYNKKATNQQLNAMDAKIRQSFKTTGKIKELNCCIFAMYKIITDIEKNLSLPIAQTNPGLIGTKSKWKWNQGISEINITDRELCSPLVQQNSTISYPLDVDKTSGVLIIEFSSDKFSDSQIKQMIGDAHVGCITVGKKGLAYLERAE